MKKYTKWLINLFIFLFLFSFTTSAYALQPTPQSGTGTYTGTATHWDSIGRSLVFDNRNFTTSISNGDAAYLGFTYTSKPAYSTEFEVVTVSGQRRVRGSLYIKVSGSGSQYWNYQIVVTPSSFNPNSTSQGRSLVDNLLREAGVDAAALRDKLAQGGDAWISSLVSVKNGSTAKHSTMSNGRKWSDGSGNYSIPSRVFSTSVVTTRFSWGSTIKGQIAALFDNHFVLPPIGEIKEPPSTPGSFSSPTSAVTAGSTITVKWGGTSFWGYPSTGKNYRLQVSYNGGSYSTVADKGTSTSHSYTVSSSSTYSTVRFRVAAQSGGGSSGWSYSSTLNIKPGVPSSISYGSAIRGGNNISVSWGAAVSADSYRLQRRYRNTDGTYTSWSSVYTGTARSASIATSTSTGYNGVEFRVRAEKSNGEVSSYRTGSLSTLYHNPSTPGTFTVPTSGVTAGSSLIVRWGATSYWGNPSGNSNYRLEVSINGGSWTHVADTGTTVSRSYTISTTASHNTIRFRVRAESTGGNSDYRYSNTVNIVPGAISSISYASSVNLGSNISVSWGASSGASSYQLERRYQKTDGTYTSWTNVYSGSATSSIVAVDSYTGVQFRVRGVKGNGEVQHIEQEPSAQSFSRQPHQGLLPALHLMFLLVVQ